MTEYFSVQINNFGSNAEIINEDFSTLRAALARVEEKKHFISDSFYLQFFGCGVHSHGGYNGNCPKETIAKLWHESFSYILSE